MQDTHGPLENLSPRLNNRGEVDSGHAGNGLVLHETQENHGTEIEVGSDQGVAQN